MHQKIFRKLDFYVGISLLPPVLIVFMPSSLAKYNPINAVKKIRDMVIKAPILAPIFINRKISIAGIPKNKKKNEFICLIQKYIINVYLSNYE